MPGTPRTSRNETDPIFLSPRDLPPATSWWTEHGADRSAWYARACAEFARMQGSEFAKRIVTRCLDDIRL